MLKKSFLTLAAVCLPHLIFTHISNDLVKNHYPNAYAWYLSISEKYPDAKLNTIEFCISDHHHAKNHIIYFPKSSIEFIDNSYNVYCQSNEITQKLAEEEYLLLHEAAHAIGYDYEKGEFVKTAAILTGTSNLFYSISQLLTQSIQPTQAAIKNTITIALLAAGVFSYARLQEKNADHFANQTVDQKTLEAGIAWHNQNKTDLNLSPDSSSIKNLLLEQINDLAHPRPTKREQRAQNSYKQRFESIN
jgi:hypothetical protein